MGISIFCRRVRGILALEVDEGCGELCSLYVGARTSATISPYGDPVRTNERCRTDTAELSHCRAEGSFHDFEALRTLS